MRLKVFLLTLTVLITFIPGMVSSHGVSITAHWEGNEVHTDSYFADGKPVGNARVVVFNMKGDVSLEGITDETGTWDFPNPKAGDLRIVMTTSSGHRNETVLKEGSANKQKEYLDNRLASLQDSILELEKQISKPGLSEILGGFGWIVGLAGAYLWGVSRRRGDGESGRMGEGEHGRKSDAETRGHGDCERAPQREQVKRG